MNPINENPELSNLIAGIPSVHFPLGGLRILQPEDMQQGQLGFSIDEKGESLCRNKKGSWKSNWVVIGEDLSTGDPLIADLSMEGNPVCIAMKDQGIWECFPIADSLANFRMAMALLEKITNGSLTGNEISSSHTNGTNWQTFLAGIERDNPNSEHWYWEALAEQG